LRRRRIFRSRHFGRRRPLRRLQVSGRAGTLHLGRWRCGRLQFGRRPAALRRRGRRLRKLKIGGSGARRRRWLLDLRRNRRRSGWRSTGRGRLRRGRRPGRLRRRLGFGNRGAPGQARIAAKDMPASRTLKGRAILGQNALVDPIACLTTGTLYFDHCLTTSPQRPGYSILPEKLAPYAIPSTGAAPGGF